MTLEQKAKRAEVVKSLLTEKHSKRIHHIGLWIDELVKLLVEQSRIQDIRKNSGFFKRKFRNIAEPDLSICDDLNTLITKSKEFKAAYTISVFLAEHKSVEGIDQILDKYDSELFTSYLGYVENRILELGNEYGYVSKRIICTINSPFVIEHGFYRDPSQNIGSDSPFKAFGGIGDWDSEFKFSPVVLHQYVWILSTFGDVSPEPEQEILCSDSVYKQCWIGRWEKNWWKKADPDEICSSNPFQSLEKALR